MKLTKLVFMGRWEGVVKNDEMCCLGSER